jgi:hypothetical protein
MEEMGQNIWERLWISSCIVSTIACYSTENGNGLLYLWQNCVYHGCTVKIDNIILERSGSPRKWSVTKNDCVSGSVDAAWQVFVNHWCYLLHSCLRAVKLFKLEQLVLASMMMGVSAMAITSDCEDKWVFSTLVIWPWGTISLCKKACFGNSTIRLCVLKQITFCDLLLECDWDLKAIWNCDWNGAFCMLWRAFDQQSVSDGATLWCSRIRAIILQPQWLCVFKISLLR